MRSSSRAGGWAPSTSSARTATTTRATSRQKELHRLTARNMDKLVGAVEVYFAGQEADGKQLPTASGKAEGYKCVLNSKASEDSHANLARWELAHDKFAFRHPCDQYKNVGGCASVVARCARVLGEASSSVAAMTTSWSLDLAVAEMNTAVQDLQCDLRALPAQLAEESPAHVMDAVQLFTVTPSW